MGEHHNITKAFTVLWAHWLCHITLCGAPHTLRTCTPWWLPELWCKTLDRQLMPSGPTTFTTMETDKKEDRLTLGMSELAVPLQLTTSQSETLNLNILLSCDPLTSEPMKIVAVSAAPGPFPEPPHLSCFWTCFQTNIQLWSVDSPLRFCQVMSQKTNY